MNLPDVELRASQARTTQAVDIVAFVDAQEIPFQYFGTPYRLAPVPGGEKLYALLCDELRRSSKIGIACVVIHARQHLAALTPQGRSLMLTTLRWMNEMDDDASGIDTSGVDTSGVDTSGVDALYLDDAGSDELLFASRKVSATPQAGGFDLDYMGAAWPHAFQPGITALEEQMMKDKKTAGILVEELDGLLDDDEYIDEMYLTPALRRNPHPVNGYAMRAGRSQGQRPAAPSLHGRHGGKTGHHLGASLGRRRRFG